MHNNSRSDFDCFVIVYLSCIPLNTFFKRNERQLLEIIQFFHENDINTRIIPDWN